MKNLFVVPVFTVVDVLKSFCVTRAPGNSVYPWRDLQSEATNVLIGPYPQHFIFFATYKWAQQARMFVADRPIRGVGKTMYIVSARFHFFSAAFFYCQPILT